MMRIAFNATTLLSPLTGIGRYTYHLAKGLQGMSNLDLNLFYAASWSREVRETPLKGAVTLKSLIKRLVPNAYAVNRYIQQRRFDHGIRTYQPDIYHEPNFLSYRFAGPTVVTVHDLSWIRYPETHSSQRVRALNRYFEACLHSASVIIAVSEFVRKELMEVFSLPATKIRAIHHGVEEIFHPRHAAETRSVLGSHRLVHGQYFLAVGTLEPRKNLLVALEAYAMLPPDVRKRYPLVLAGMKGWHTKALELKMAPMVRRGEIRLAGYLAQHELVQIVAGATALIYPSIYEGFGLPPLEAMASGVPVIVSNASSIPEVVGDAGLYVNPDDPDGLSVGMKNIALDPDARKYFSHKGLARSAGFTWQKCTLETLDAYHQVSGKRSH